MPLWQAQGLFFTCPRELSTVLLKLEVSVRFPPQYRPPSPISSGSLDTHTQYTSLPQDNATPRTRYTISEEKSHKVHNYTMGSVMLLNYNQLQKRCLTGYSL